MVSLRHFPSWYSAAVPFQLIILSAPFRTHFRSIPKSFTAFANAGLLQHAYIDVYEPQTANRPTGGGRVMEVK